MYDAGAAYRPLLPSEEAAEDQSDASLLDFRELFAAIYRSRYMVLGIIIGCLIVGIAVTFLITRQYAGLASVEVRQEAQKVLGTEQDREGASSKIDIERFLDTQVDLVRSRRVATAVAEELGLFRNENFLDTMNVTRRIEGNGYLSEQEAFRETVIKALLDNLEVGYTGQTRILNIRFYSPDARLSARVANSFANNFIISNLQRKSDSSSYARDFLREQLREAQTRLAESERAALDYARRERIVDASNAARADGASVNAQPQSLVTAQLVQLNQSYSLAVATRVEAEQRWRRAQGVPMLNMPEVLGNLAVQDLLQRRAVIEAELKEQLQTRQESHPSIIQAQARLNEINRQLAAVASSIRDTILGQYEIAARQERQLQGQIERLKGRTLVEQNQSIQLSILRREADTNRQQYEALLVRYNQLNAEAGVQANNLAVVDRAVPNPKPAWPKIPLNLALSLLAGIVLSGLYVLAQMRLFDKVRTPVDVTERLHVPLLTAIPVSKDVIEDVTDPKSNISEAFNLARTALSLSSEDGVPHSVMVTSVQASEGKTSCCVSLAIGFSRLGKRVLVIDLDLRRPNVHRLLGLANTTGASAVLSGQVSAAEAIQKTAYAGVDAVVGGAISPNPTDLLMGHQLEAVLNAMGKNYDLLLIDSPPVLALADAEILAKRVEATVFVIESGRNSRSAVQTAMARLRRSGAHITGVVLSKYDPGELGYGYGDMYGYKYGYGAQEKRTVAGD